MQFDGCCTDLIQSMDDDDCQTMHEQTIHSQLLLSLYLSNINKLMYYFQKELGFRLRLFTSFFPDFFRFYTGANIWSAQVNITKCRIKSATDDASRGGAADGSSRRGQSRNNQRLAAAQNIDYNSCPLQISVAPRRPPDVLDPKTRYIMT